MPVINGKITIGDFVLRFEAIYGDIRSNRKRFGSAFHKYYGQLFDWSQYDYALAQLRLTSIAPKWNGVPNMQREISRLPENVLPRILK